jgi:hypothetical protein
MEGMELHTIRSWLKAFLPNLESTKFRPESFHLVNKWMNEMFGHEGLRAKDLGPTSGIKESQGKQHE